MFLYNFSITKPSNNWTFLLTELFLNFLWLASILVTQIATFLHTTLHKLEFPIEYEHQIFQTKIYLLLLKKK